MRNYISWIAILVLTIIWFTSCNYIPPTGGYVDRNKSRRYYYGITKRSIYYKDYSPIDDLRGIFGIPTYRCLKDADAKSFEVLSSGVGKDKNAVYVQDTKKDYVDAATFHYNSDGVACDNKHVYCSDYLDIIYDADPHTFEFIDEEYIFQWAKDNSNYYHKFRYECGKANVDYHSFQFINFSFARDKNHLYTYDISKKELIQTDVNPNGYKSVTKFYIHDDKNIYFCNYVYDSESSLMIIPLENAESVRPFINTENEDKENFIAADNYIYYKGEKFIEVTTPIESYKIFSLPGHYKNKNHVYYSYKIIPEADPSSYDYMVEIKAYADDKHVFYKGIPIEGADPGSMMRIDEIFTKDKNNVYQNWELIEGIKPIRFEKLKDYKYHYTDGEKIFYCEDQSFSEFFEVEGADINTYRYDRRSKMYKDCHGSYYAGHKIR